MIYYSWCSIFIYVFHFEHRYITCILLRWITEINYYSSYVKTSHYLYVNMLSRPWIAVVSPRNIYHGILWVQREFSCGQNNPCGWLLDFISETHAGSTKLNTFKKILLVTDCSGVTGKLKPPILSRIRNSIVKSF